MPLLAENLVDEWLNREGFFTVRGIRDGVQEIDLLGVRKAGSGVQAWHVEVQASFRPVNYLTPLTKELAQRLGKERRQKVKRTPEMVTECVRNWVKHKFKREDKATARENAWPGINWEFHFVHAVVLHPEELTAIEVEGVKITSLFRVLLDLSGNSSKGAHGAAGTDIADMITFYERMKGSL